MTIPDYQTIMLPLLEFIYDQQERSVREAIEYISNNFGLTKEERKELLPSGQQPIIDNRVGWARTYLKKAVLLEDPKRGYIKITDRGLKVLEQKPERIDVKFLEKFPEFVEFRKIKKETTKDTLETKEELEEETPDELMERGNNLIKASLAQELLYQARKSDPYYFEK